MWSSLDVVLGIGFMVAWAIASAAGGAIAVVVYASVIGRRAASADKAPAPTP